MQEKYVIVWAKSNYLGANLENSAIIWLGECVTGGESTVNMNPDRPRFNRRGLEWFGWVDGSGGVLRCVKKLFCGPVDYYGCLGVEG